MDGSVRGAEDFLRLSKALKAAGEKDLRKKLNKGIREGVKKHMPKATDALADVLPSGLQSKGKRTKQAVQTRTGNTPGVTVAVRYGRGGRGLGASNAQKLNQGGTFRHPVFRRSKFTSLNSGEGKLAKGPWVEQDAPGAEGWFDETWLEAAPEVRRALQAAMQQVIDEIERNARG